MRRCAQENKEKRAECLVFLRHSALFYGQQIRVLTRFLTHDSTGSRKGVFLQGGDQLLMLFGRTTFVGICDIVHVFNSRHMAFKCLNEAF